MQAIQALLTVAVTLFGFEGAARYAPLAQLVEHLTLNQGVQGSNPWRRIKYRFWRHMSSGVGAFFVFQLTRLYSLEESRACTRIFQTVRTRGAPLNEQNSCEAAISTERAVLRI